MVADFLGRRQRDVRLLEGGPKLADPFGHLFVAVVQLEAVVKLPAGVFKPYAGVSTAIVMFTKGGQTKDVWFYDVQADGFSLSECPHGMLGALR